MPRIAPRYVIVIDSSWRDVSVFCAGSSVIGSGAMLLGREGSSADTSSTRTVVHPCRPITDRQSVDRVSSSVPFLVLVIAGYASSSLRHRSLPLLRLLKRISSHFRRSSRSLPSRPVLSLARARDVTPRCISNFSRMSFQRPQRAFTFGEAK